MLWRTKDGRILPIEDVTDDHLQNIHRMLNHKEVAMAKDISGSWMFAGAMQGEYAAYYADKAIDQLEDRYDDLVATILDVESEMVRRDLVVEGGSHARCIA